MIHKILNRIETIGIDDSMSFDTIRRIKISNKLLLIALISMFLFVFADIKEGLYIPALTLSASFLLFILCFYLTSKKLSNLSSFLAVVGISVAITINAYVIKADAGIAYILLALIGVPVINIDLSKKTLLLSSIFTVFTLFVITILFNFTQVGIYTISKPLEIKLLFGALLQAVILILAQILFFLKEMDYRYQQHEEQHEKLLMQGRMSDLGIMSAGIAHEINNPLTIIQSHAALLEKDRGLLPLDSSTKKHLERIKESVQRISRIIKSIKYLSRDYSHDPFEHTSVRQIIERIEDIFHERLLSLNINLKIHMNDEDFKLKCRGGQLEQVFVSLLSNSIDALKEIEDAYIKITISQDSNLANIMIEDNGPGIAEEDAPHLMKTFYTTKPTGQGTGMGLSIAKKIVENHRGTLTLDSLHPTRFLISLPLLSEDTA